MKSIKLTGLRRMEMFDVPKPELASDHDVLIKMAAIGICGSDVHYFAEGGIGVQVVQYPYAAGHEGAGVVEAVGAAVTQIKVGDRVAFDPAISCWECDQCLAGRSHTCRRQSFLGCPGQVEGCLAEYLVLPDRNCFPIPDSMTLEEAAIAEPLSIGLHGIALSIPLAGAKIGILGAGPIGLSVLLPAKAMGAGRVYMTDKIDARLDVASRAGADWVGNPDKIDVVQAVAEREPGLLDVVFECSGKQEAMDQGVELLKPGGKLMLIGIPGAHNRVSFDINQLRRKEITVQNVRRQNEQVQNAIDMIANRTIDVSVMITHRFPFERTQEGFDMVTDYQDGVVKAMVLVG
ncbi:sorbitol dehydrogenase [Capsulimonas corticalis]|uniref:Sorbitol dehydrogenase n=1 Tax=Capsulimonas corticalis TaxID=2219043 RepID=A0A402D3B5_9BACT|nr:alcohol dehydrogenase catalytic domain-containing protein [Capsulimonas corticalis]BDI28524.1 sorbitol dehydrogenase [Capsulimonas corticalis]